ncbi:30S ribosomal protein S9 [Pirellulaceae bacterium]|jgi:small subunit ribosomal protein S9|nr:30S ribosomal protein S9 [Pirellulaceae bacterium]
MPAVVRKCKSNQDSLGTGRRKSSVARVRVRPGTGQITINKRPFEEYFKFSQNRRAVLEVLELTGNSDDVDVIVRCNGGGTTGQAGAVRMGLARAMVSHNEENFLALRSGGFLTRDSRMSERKKPGLHGARRGSQFSKR